MPINLQYSPGDYQQAIARATRNLTPPYLFDLQRMPRRIISASHAEGCITLTYEGGIIKFPTIDLNYIIGENTANVICVKGLLAGITLHPIQNANI